jgi:hypothetical protein
LFVFQTQQNTNYLQSSFEVVKVQSTEIWHYVQMDLICNLAANFSSNWRIF